MSRCGCTGNRVEPVYHWSGKWQDCEAKYHFVFYVFRRLMFCLIFIYVLFTLIGRLPWCELQLIDLYIDFQCFVCEGELVNKKLVVVECLEAWMELMRGFRGSMEVYLFMTYVVQVKYMWMFSLRCCLCMGRSSTYQDGSFERILLLCVSSNGGVLRRLGIFLLVSIFVNCYNKRFKVGWFVMKLCGGKLGCSRKGLWVVCLGCHIKRSW